jgi:2-dehydropantoate 2-reductase
MLGTWLESIEALNKAGVRLVGMDGVEHSYPVEATNDPLDCVGSRFAIVMVKSYQTKRVAQQLSVCLAEEGLALTLQNGLGNDITLAEVLGAERIASGVTTVGATLIEPGLIRLGGDGVISLGKNERLQSLAELLIKAGFEVETVKNTDSLVWGKLVINASINPLTALLEVPNGDLVTNPSTRTLMGLVANETAEVSLAKGINLPYLDPVAMVESVAQKTASNQSSMLKDVIRNSPTEIDAINGAVVRVGEAINVPVDINRTLWLLVKALTAKTATGEKGRFN